jgi:hypothetical protein
VDDVLEISHAGSFTDGSFAFLTAGQKGAIFQLDSSAFATTDPVFPIDPPNPSVVPLPAGLSLMLAALGMFGLLRRRTV